jgi:hypothetical protein
MIIVVGCFIEKSNISFSRKNRLKEKVCLQILNEPPNNWLNLHDSQIGTKNKK